MTGRAHIDEPVPPPPQSTNLTYSPRVFPLRSDAYLKLSVEIPRPNQTRGRDGTGGYASLARNLLGRPGHDSEHDEFFSLEGCQQGDPLGPFLWAIGYHRSLLLTQARHPTALVVAYVPRRHV